MRTKTGIKNEIRKLTGLKNKEMIKIFSLPADDKNRDEAIRTADVLCSKIDHLWWVLT